MKTFAFVLVAALSFTACKKSDKADSKSDTPKATEPAAPGATAAAAAPAAAPAGDTTDVDLSPGGAAWKGWAIKAPAATKITDNGAGGVSVDMGDLQFEMNQGDLHLSDVKSGNQSGAEMSKAKFTYTTDKPDALEWTSETPNADGAAMKGYGFSYYANAANKIGCRAMVDDEKQVAAIKAVCNSVHKK